MQSLRQNAFTCEQRGTERFEALHSPAVVDIGAIQQGHQRSRVSKALFHFPDLPKDCIRSLLIERSPSLLAPRFSGFSNRSRAKSKQLPGATASLSLDKASSACSINRVSVVLRLLASALRRAFWAFGTLMESVSVMTFLA